MLRRHHAEGRLDTGELEARIGSSYTATTIGDLHDLVGDLPHAWPAAVTPDHAARHEQPPVWIVATLTVALTLVVLLAVGATHLLWLAAIPIGIALKRRGSLGYCRATALGPSPARRVRSGQMS